MHKISVVMLTYCHEKYVTEALQSVIDQDVDAMLEIIIADDFSKDRTREIIEEFITKNPNIEGKREYKLLFQKTNVGAKKNMVCAFNACTGEYVAYLEGDDYWTDSSKLRLQLDYMNRNPECSIVTHYISRSLFDGTLTETVYQRFVPEKQIITAEDAGAVIGHSSSVFFRHYGQEFLTYVNKLAKERFCPGDTALPLFFLTKGYVYVIPIVMSNYRFVQKEGGTNWSSKHQYYRDFLYFYMIAYRHEKIAKRLGLSVDCYVNKVYYCADAYRVMLQFHSKKQFLSILVMILLTPKKVAFVKDVRSRIEEIR